MILTSSSAVQAGHAQHSQIQREAARNSRELKRTLQHRGGQNYDENSRRFQLGILAGGEASLQIHIQACHARGDMASVRGE